MVIVEILNVVLPVFLLMGVGFVVGRYMRIDSKSVSDLSIYVFSPALFFYSISTSEMDMGDFGRVVLFAFSLFLLFALFVYATGKILKWDKVYQNTLMLASGFPNAGNYGLPIILFAFGEEGVAIGIIYLAMQSFLMNSAGVFYASNHAEVPKKDIFLQVIRMPGVIAILLALVLKIGGIPIPQAVENATSLLGQASIPTMLTLLGVTLASIQIKNVLSFIGTATIFKLVALPALAFLLLGLIYPAGSLEAKVLLIGAATPTAATTTLLAIKFGMNPDMVSSAMFVSTLASIVTIPLLLLMV
ncbi:AEC family transporter [Planomicrobium sp. CPCC 101079]|uniref:AEC family transporter n=1 Tax=Planomicrobium sp. CPCC 101079 TaxID=2599618 RepID=UPI0011B39D8F|nr:AEC family transporter [Planomicrobium sp. CPCC 101079]TWT03621.1 AEC family transporter [Planomicrobium sp. CPCC 101079]